MNLNNKYFLFLLAVLLAGCKKKKKTKTLSESSEVQMQTESENINEQNDNETKVEFVEKSLVETSSVNEAPASSDAVKCVFFGYDRCDVESKSSALNASVEYLLQNTTATVTIYGNCDKRGSAEYNMGLGARRAQAAKRYLTSRGIEEHRIKTISIGQTIFVEGDNEYAYSKNRVAIIVLDGDLTNSNISNLAHFVEIASTQVVSTQSKAGSQPAAKAVPVAKPDADADEDEDDDN